MKKRSSAQEVSPQKRHRKKSGESHFGRCTPRQCEVCEVCSEEGKHLCSDAPYDESRGPRKGRKEKDDRPFTPIPHEALRWNLGSEFDGAFKTYVYLLTWTTKNTNLVYQAADHLTIGRGIALKTFYAHVQTLVDLKLVQKVPRTEVFPRGRKGQGAYFLLPLPSWARDIAELTEQLSKARGGRSEADQIRLALASRKKHVLKYLEIQKDNRKKN